MEGVDESDDEVRNSLRSRLQGGFWSDDRLLKFLIFVLLVMLVVLSFTLRQQVAIQDTQRGIEAEQQLSVERSNINRALNCAIVRGLGMELPEDCLWSHITEYYDPSADPVAGVDSEGQRVNRRLLCQILATIEGHAPECRR